MSTIEGLAPYLAGPGAAVLVLVGVVLAVYRLVVQYLMPAAKAVVDRHMSELEKANARHEEAVAKHMSHIGEMGQRYDRLANMHAEQHANILQAVASMHTDIGDRSERIERKLGGLYSRFEAMKDAS